MSRPKKRPANKRFLKNLLLIVMSLGLLFISTNAFSQDAKTIKEEKSAEKRKDVKNFFKKLNPFKKHDDADNSSADANKTVPAPPAPAPAPTPTPAPAPTPSPSKTTASTKKKVKKTTTVKKATTAQPFM